MFSGDEFYGDEITSGIQPIAAPDAETYTFGMATTEEQSIVAQLKDAIRESGLTQMELSDRSGVPQATISRFLSGEQDLRATNLAALCRAMGLELRKAKGRKR